MATPDTSPGYLTPDEVIAINEQVTGQQGQLRDQAGLESALLRPQTAVHYQQADLIEQVAFLIEGLAMNHPFVDGNKRIALVAGLILLRTNGYTIESEPLQAARMLIQLIIDGNRENFISWLRNHTTSWTESNDQQQDRKMLTIHILQDFAADIEYLGLN